MNTENRQFRLAKDDLQHLTHKFVLAARFETLECVEISICSALP